jgi:pimeloyl-ACP methyl ester carboxylesterase
VARDHGDLYVREYAGKGPAFVTLHGFPDNLHIFDDVVPHLVAAGRRVVTFDFLGFGASAKPAGYPYSFEHQLGELKAVADTLSLDRIIPVAHDAGGPTGVNFALQYPERTEYVCLLNCFYGSAPTLRLPEFIEVFATKTLRALSQHFLQSPEQFAWLLNLQRTLFQQGLTDAQVAHYETFLGPAIDQNFRQKPSAAPAFARMTSQTFDEVARNDGRIDELKRSRVPFRLIWGDIDPYLNKGVAEDLASKISTVTTTFLRAGHWPQIDLPQDTARTMLA